MSIDKTGDAIAKAIIDNSPEYITRKYAEELMVTLEEMKNFVYLFYIQKQKRCTLTGKSQDDTIT